MNFTIWLRRACHIISLSCLILILKPEPPKPIEYEYETLHIELNNTNDFSNVNGEIIDYLCDENVAFTNYGDSYYASTIEIPDSYYEEWTYRGYGECMIKIKREISA